MHIHTLEQWQHDHNFSNKQTDGEKRTYHVLLLTVITMVIEIVAGKYFGSMALLADGWHMGTHVAAFAIAIFAFRYANRHANNPHFSFGTGKVNALGGFASAVALAVVAALIAIESLNRLFSPQQIHFNEAILVAVLGLVVNLVSALILQGHHNHSHKHENESSHDQHNHHHDHNLKAAYFHVLADALTSLLAIIALIAGKYLGWNWLDPIMGIVGALVITSWAWRLLRDTSSILLDKRIDGDRENKIKKKIESDADNRVSDIHIWDTGAGHYAAIISLVTHYGKSPDYYKKLLSGFRELAHITVEVNNSETTPCYPIKQPE